MPAGLRDIANWNPTSAIAAACRNLFGGINPSTAVAAWPMQYPELAVLAWSARLIAIFAPLAVILYRRKVSRLMRPSPITQAKPVERDAGSPASFPA